MRLSASGAHKLIRETLHHLGHSEVEDLILAAAEHVARKNELLGTGVQYPSNKPLADEIHESRLRWRDDRGPAEPDRQRR